MKAVADAGPLIHLSWINQLNLLAVLFDEVLVPSAVEREVLRAGPGVPGVGLIAAAFAAGSPRVQPVEDRAAVSQLRVATGLDPGESEAIVLLREAAADLLLIDERKARAYAETQGVPVMGTLGILRRARDRGLVGAVSPLLDELRLRGFWISAEIVDRIGREEAP